MTGDFFKNLPLCENLENLEIPTAWNLGVSGFETISKLRNLKCLETWFAMQIDYSKANNSLLRPGKGVDTGLRPGNMSAWFENKNMEHLEKLSLAGCESLMDNRQLWQSLLSSRERLGDYLALKASTLERAQ